MGETVGKSVVEWGDMEVEQIIKLAVERELEDLGLPKGRVELEHPGDEKHGDYSTNVAMRVFGEFKIKNEELEIGGGPAGMDYKNPREIAEKIAEKLNAQGEGRVWERVEVGGQGFVNFYLTSEFLWGEVKRVGELGEGYGRSKEGSGKRVIVEYSSPNIAKPFTIGHLRSTIIGYAIANLMEATGWKVMRDNHLGDWGTQFGKQIVAIKKWGNLDEIEKSENRIAELVDLYVKFHKEAEGEPALEDEARAWFKKLEDGDEEAREIWQKCVNWSWKEFAGIYEMLEVKFSPEFDGGRGLGEAFFEDKMGVVIEELEEKGLLKEGEGGARLVFFPGDKYPPAMIIKGDGATLYHTRDLATDKYRKEKYNPDLIVNEVGMEQTLYFRQLFEIEAMLGWYKQGQRVHVGHGMYRFQEGKMSTRKGNVVWLAEVLKEAERRALALQKEGVDEGLARKVGVGAMKWNDLKGEPKRDIVFEWDEVLSMQGNSGPYMQYTYARTQSLLGKATELGISGEELMEIAEIANLEEMAVLRWIWRYPEAVAKAAAGYAPHTLCTYLYELASRFNAFYNKHRILPGEGGGLGEEAVGRRVALTKAVGQILGNGLTLLGVAAVGEM